MFDNDEIQIGQITRLIDDMLDISRISSGKLSMNLERFDLCELGRDLIKQRSDQFVEAGLSQLKSSVANCGKWDRFSH